MRNPGVGPVRVSSPLLFAFALVVRAFFTASSAGTSFGSMLVGQLQLSLIQFLWHADHAQCQVLKPQTYFVIVRAERYSHDPQVTAWVDMDALAAKVTVASISANVRVCCASVCVVFFLLSSGAGTAVFVVSHGTVWPRLFELAPLSSGSLWEEVPLTTMDMVIV